MGPLSLLAAERKRQSAHTQSYAHSVRSVFGAGTSHHSSPPAPAQVHPGNIAHTAAWRSRRHLRTDGKQSQLNSSAQWDDDRKQHEEKRPDRYEVMVGG